VVVENYRPNPMQKLGLGYEVLKEINPKIIYVSVRGFGHKIVYPSRWSRVGFEPKDNLKRKRTGLNPYYIRL